MPSGSEEKQEVRQIIKARPVGEPRQAAPAPARAPVSSGMGRVMMKTSVTERVPTMGAKNGMFEGSPFSNQAVQSKVMPQRVQAVPQSGSFGTKSSDRFVPSAARTGAPGMQPIPSMGSSLGSSGMRPVPQRGSPFGASASDKFSPSGASGAGLAAGQGLPLRGSVGPKLARRPRMGDNGDLPSTTQEINAGADIIQQGGKAVLSLDEAKELLSSLEIALAPVSSAEAAQEEHECLRELRSGAFPIVSRLAEKLRKFIATATPESTFTISQGEVSVTGKALDCAASIGRDQTIKTVATVAGAGGAIALLLLL